MSDSFDVNILCGGVLYHDSSLQSATDHTFENVGEEGRLDVNGKEQMKHDDFDINEW